MKRGKSMAEKLGPLGRGIRRTGAASFYHNGDGAGFVWRWWHPLSWVLAPLFFLLHCGACGVPDAWRYRHETGLRMDPWFIKNPSHLEWDQQ